jgi:TATA-box binding protein (TBP) (component of TFIID and TFIIIB)
MVDLKIIVKPMSSTLYGDIGVKNINLEFLHFVIINFYSDNIEQIKIKNGKGSFKNQLGLSIQYSKNKNASVKLFRNGKIQLTGIKNLNIPDTVKIVSGKLNSFLISIAKEFNLTESQCDSLNKNCLVNKSTGEIRGYRVNDEVYIFNNMTSRFSHCLSEIINNSNLFIEKQHTKLLKYIFDENYNLIGELNYFFEDGKKRKNVILNHKSGSTIFDPETQVYTIVAYNKYILCHYKYKFYSNEINKGINNFNFKVILPDKFCFNDEHNVKIANINVVFQTNFTKNFNYFAFFNYIKTHTNFTYEHAGNKKITFKLFLNIECDTCYHKTKKSCSCSKLIIHKTGNFILSGVTKIEDIEPIKNKFIKIYEKYLDSFMCVTDIKAVETTVVKKYTIEDILAILYGGNPPKTFLKPKIEIIKIVKNKKEYSFVSIKNAIDKIIFNKNLK